MKSYLIAGLLVVSAAGLAWAQAKDYSNASYSELQRAQVDAASRVARTGDSVDAAIEAISRCITDINALETEYATVITGVGNLPEGTSAEIRAKENLDASVRVTGKDRNNLKTYCTNLEAAIAGVARVTRR